MVVVVTGASKGIGKAVALKFASAGYTVVICARNQASLQATADEIFAEHPHATIHAMAVNMADKQEVIAFGKEVLKITRQVSILVNNAGSFLPGNVHTEEDGVIEQMINTNLYSAYHLTRVLLPGMMQAKRGHIFNMCSIASLDAYPNGGSYSISKFALAGFSKNLREELKSYNIKVTGIYPGAVYTNSWAGSGVDPQRIMKPEDVADLVYTVSTLSPQACVEDIVLRPQFGDL
jgi:NADP-dependent 3-hydroxy acid dehydrogenase YdfG